MYSQRDKKFDELLNANCSWSYKSQKYRLNDPETDKKRFEIIDIEQNVEMYGSKNKPESNNRSYYRKNENLSTSAPDKINRRRNNKWKKNSQVELNSSQMKAYGKNSKMQEIKPQKKSVKQRLSQPNKITDMNSTQHSILSSASSSEDDVFQTRYSINNKHDSEVNDDINKHVLNSTEKNPDGKYTSGNISNMKTPPVKFEAKGYPVIAKQAHQTKKQRETKNKTELKDYFGEENNSTADIKNDSVQFSDDSLNADFDFSDNMPAEKSNKCIKEMMVDVTVTPKQSVVSTNIEKPSVADEDNIIEDFLNGTFDITAFQSVSSKNRIFSNQHVNNKPKSLMQMNEGKRNNKKSINELVTETKRVKGKILESKNGKEMWRNKRGTKERNKKASKKELNGAKNLNANQLLNTFSRKLQPEQKKKNFDSFNININFLGLTDSPYENRQMKSKNCQMKYEDKNAYNTDEGSIQNKYSRRKVRNSSRIASRKIKEIESIEKLVDLNQEIIDVEKAETDINDGLFNAHKEHNNKEILHSLRRNSNTYKQNIASTNKKKEKYESSNSVKIIDSEDTETNMYDDLFNTHNEHNDMGTQHSLRRHSNTFKPKSASSNKKKEKYANKNSEMSIQHENEFTAIKKRENIITHLEANKNNASDTDDKRTSSLSCSSKIPIKRNACKDDKKIQSSSLNSFYSYMTRADLDLSKGNQTFKKKGKTDVDSKNFDFVHHSNSFFMGENSLTEDTNNLTISKESTRKRKSRAWEIEDTNNLTVSKESTRKRKPRARETEDTHYFTVSKGYTKKSKPRTWEMLENELLKDLDSEQTSDNVCQTVILKKQETVMKKELAKDRNLFTVSNTSMMHTISKSKSGNNYNLKFEIKNTKSKFIGPKTDPKCNFVNTTNAQQMTDKDSNFKSNAIVNKTIVAMEKCAAKFISSKVKVCNAELMESNWQLENLSDNLDTHQKTQFYSHLTFEANNDDKKCYSNEVIDYTTKINEVPQSCNFSEEGNLSKEKSNLKRTQRNTRGSQKTLSTEYPYESNKSNLPLEYPQSHTNYDKTQALVPYEGERNNPWENLIDKLYLQEEHSSLEEISDSNYKLKDQNTESLIITNTYTQNSNNLERKEALLIQTDYEINKTKLGKEAPSDQYIPADVELDTEQSTIPEAEIKKNSPMQDLTSINIRYQTDRKEINYQENNNCKKFELQKGSNEKHEAQLLNIVNAKTKVKSPSFKFQLNKHGALKLKKQSSVSSSSEISEDSQNFKRTKLHEKKGRKCNSSATNKARDKYKIYLKKLLYKQNSTVDEEKIKSTEDTTVSLDKFPQSISKTKDSLIAMQEDDIFSLSSSDESSDSSKKNYGTGAMCELFDK